MSIRKVGAIVWTSRRVEKVLKFYRTIGIPLEADKHDGPSDKPHYECDIGGTHFAVFPSPDEHLEFRSEIPTLIGLEVDNLDEIIAAISVLGSPIRTPLEASPWGNRVVVLDPDGRPVELYQPTAINAR